MIFVSTHRFPQTSTPTPHQHRNLIRDAIVSLAEYGLHFRDEDEPVITITLQLLLYERLDRTLLGQPHSNKCTNSNSTTPLLATGSNIHLTPITMTYISGSKLRHNTHILTGTITLIHLHRCCTNLRKSTRPSRRRQLLITMVLYKIPHSQNDARLKHSTQS